MFIIIPLSIALCSFVGMGIIVYRKVPYLKKLTPETVTGSLFSEMAPELQDAISTAKLREYRDSFLLDVEKLLRRTRLVFLRIDAASEALIKKIRKSHLEAKAPQLQPVTIPVQPSIQVSPATPKVRKGGRRATDQELKDEEQNLIMAIAKSPKNVALYIALGETYMKMGNFDDAKEAFEAALKLDEENEKAINKLDRVMNKIDAA